MIAVLDYGIGNLRSAHKALQHVGADAQLVTEPSQAVGATAFVLPGVGAFGACVEALHKSGLDDVVRAAVEAEMPVLGICVGFQMLFAGSDESPGIPGLGILEGTLRAIPRPEKRPQMQWNRLCVSETRESVMLAPFAEPPWVYFVHSYAVFLDDELKASLTGHSVVATCEYGGSVVAAIEQGSTWGTQFHPEKSGSAGLQLLRQFVDFASGSPSARGL